MDARSSAQAEAGRMSDINGRTRNRARNLRAKPRSGDHVFGLIRLAGATIVHTAWIGALGYAP